MTKIAVTVQVAVDNATFHFDKLYTYIVPAHLINKVFIGSMVLVPFGKGSHARMGVVLGTLEQDDTSKLKSLFDTAPEIASLSGELLDMVHYLKENTFCTYYEAVKAIIPYGAQYKANTSSTIPTLQKRIVRHTQNAYSLANAGGTLTPKQSLAISLITQDNTPQEVLENNGISKAVLDNMCKKNIITRKEIDKTISLYDNYELSNEKITLSPSQQKVLTELGNLLMQNVYKSALFYGVTSSGKTLVFIKLIEKVIAMGKQALILVPEISLTPQMIYRLKGVFGDRVAVQHSALANTERLLQWRQIQEGQADIVVGTRSAIFAPLSRLGLIIIDEEQEHTYHSESSPRYDARKVAQKRAYSNNALLVLASATPSIESYYAAQSGKTALVELNERYNDMPLPTVKLVDMRKEMAAGNAGAISAELAGEIQANLETHKQTILLLNRRGYKTVGMCAGCGQVLKCSACSVPMVYHKAQNKLLCHYCGNTISPVPEICPQCGGKLRYTGFGTQRVEEELTALFPKAKVLRMDMDTTNYKNAHEKMLKRFASGEYDIMLGTQMVAKGLDFERVSLVGVLGIDQLMFAQGYKAYENVFSLVTQVVGRAGRAHEPGRAIIQTVDPQNPVLHLAAKQDYKAFYKEEISFRKINLYPPFCAICLIGFSGSDEAETLHAAIEFARILSSEAEKCDNLPLRVLGPAPMSVAMMNNNYRYKLTVKCRNDNKLRQLMARVIESYNKAGLIAKTALFLDLNSDADI